MKMPAKMKAKWLKALRSGTYKQGRGTLYNPQTASFCCLGVLQHCVTGGYVEYDDDPDFYEGNPYYQEPSDEWYVQHGIKLSKGCAWDHGDLTQLIKMNDGDTDGCKGRRSFAKIADWIEKNIEVY